MELCILECRRFVAPDPGGAVKRIVRNHEFDFYKDGARTVTFDGRVYPVSAGSLCVRRPGQVCSGVGDYDCYQLTVDFSGKTPPENYLRQKSLEIEVCRENPLVDGLPEVFTPLHRKEISDLFEALCKEPERASASAKLLASELLFLMNADCCHEKYVRTQPADPDILRAADYMRQNLKEEITLDTLSAFVHSESSYFAKRFKKVYAKSPIEYLIEERLAYAALLLVNTGLTVEQIAAECGYRSTSFFIRQFKSHYAVPPGKYRSERKLR